MSDYMNSLAPSGGGGMPAAQGASGTGWGGASRDAYGKNHGAMAKTWQDFYKRNQSQKSDPSQTQIISQQSDPGTHHQYYNRMMERHLGQQQAYQQQWMDQWQQSQEQSQLQFAEWLERFDEMIQEMNKRRDVPIQNGPVQGPRFPNYPQPDPNVISPGIKHPMPGPTPPPGMAVGPGRPSPELATAPGRPSPPFVPGLPKF